MISPPRLSLVLALISASVACGTVGEQLLVGRDPLDQSDAGGANNDGYEAGTASGWTDDGGSTSAGSTPVVLYETQFEAPDECAAWTATDGTLSTAPGRTGNGCMLCATSTQTAMFMRRDLSIPQLDRGVYWLQFYAKLLRATDAGGAPQATAAFSFSDQDGTPTLLNGGGVRTDKWIPKEIGQTLFEPRPDSVLGVYVGALVDHPNGIYFPVRAGDCMVFDDLRLLIEK